MPISGLRPREALNKFVDQKDRPWPPVADGHMDPEEGAHRNISNQAVQVPGSGGETVASFWSPLPLTLVVQGRCYSRGRQHGLVSFALVWGKPSSCTLSVGDCMLCDLYSKRAVVLPSLCWGPGYCCPSSQVPQPLGASQGLSR